MTGCDIDVDENKNEIYREDDEGNQESYNPRQYEYSYDFQMTIHINSPWFDRIKFKLNDHEIESRYSAEYREAERDANEIKDTLTGLRDSAREEVVSANAPKMAVSCPHCHATTTPDISGCCEYCGGAI